MKILLLISIFVATTTFAHAEAKKDEWEEKYQAIIADVCNSIEGECHVSYSVYDKDANGLPVNNLDNTAIEGKVIVITRANFFLGKDGEYKSQVKVSPSWRELAIIANEIIIKTGDLHHIYFEGFEVVRKKNEITYIELQFGS
jgi:hypothetical protein